MYIGIILWYIPTGFKTAKVSPRSWISLLIFVSRNKCISHENAKMATHQSNRFCGSRCHYGAYVPHAFIIRSVIIIVIYNTHTPRRYTLYCGLFFYFPPPLDGTQYYFHGFSDFSFYSANDILLLLLYYAVYCNTHDIIIILLAYKTHVIGVNAIRFLIKRCYLFTNRIPLYREIV